MPANEVVEKKKGSGATPWIIAAVVVLILAIVIGVTMRSCTVTCCNKSMWGSRSKEGGEGAEPAWSGQDDVEQDQSSTIWAPPVAAPTNPIIPNPIISPQAAAATQTIPPTQQPSPFHAVATQNAGVNIAFGVSNAGDDSLGSTLSQPTDATATITGSPTAAPV